MNQILKVVEIFQSIQGEGANAGLSCVFIRLAGCNAACSFCDTEWKEGKDMSIREILEEVRKFNSTAIVWTGGEPMLQLDGDILGYFAEYKNCIETNGSYSVPEEIDYISVSPKFPERVIRSNFDFVDEIRYALAAGDPIPNMDKLPQANNYYLSPIFDGAELNQGNLEYCLNVIKENPKWKLSIQIHKLLKVQ
jgi:7-carboxy-7-deazaguanine synthase